jgi:ABC-2 type transport system ATP-binding protein
MLHFVHYRKRYGAATILEIPGLTIPSGIFWIKGANRAGKSTLLKSIGGMLHFDGNITLEGVDVHKHSVAYRRLVNFADAEPLFPEFLTGQELIDLFCDAKGGGREQTQPWLDRFDMHAYLHQPVSAYSSGMLKKLSIALAFIGNARLILLDEPCITLDTQALHELQAGIAERHRTQHTSFLISSHQPLQIEGLTPGQHLLVQNKTLAFHP